MLVKEFISHGPFSDKHDDKDAKPKVLMDADYEAQLLGSIEESLSVYKKQAAGDSLSKAMEDEEEAITSALAAMDENASAQESYRLALGRYKAGVGIQLDVLSAESSLSEARSTLIQAVVDFNKAQIQLLEAVGAVSPKTLVEGYSLTNEQEADEQNQQPDVNTAETVLEQLEQKELQANDLEKAQEKTSASDAEHEQDKGSQEHDE